MFADKIEQMKSDYTDKYVLVDATRHPGMPAPRERVNRDRGEQEDSGAHAV